MPLPFLPYLLDLSAAGGAGVPPMGQTYGPWLLYGLNLGQPASRTNTLRAGLVAALSTSPAVQAIVDSAIFPLHVPETHPLPALFYEVTDDPRDQDLDGPTGTAQATINISLLSRTFTECEAAATAVRQLLHGFTGLLGGLVPVDDIFLDNEHDVLGSAGVVIDASDRPTYEIVQEFEVFYRESLM